MTIRFCSYKEVGLPGKPEEYVAFYKGLETKDCKVSGEMLLKAGFQIPLTPELNTWKDLVYKKKRCAHCWSVTRNIADWQRHVYRCESGEEMPEKEPNPSEAEKFIYPFDNHSRMFRDY